MKIIFVSVLLLSLVNIAFTVNPCDRESPKVISTSPVTCEACPDATPYYNPYTTECVNTCPVGAPKHDDANWCRPCSDSLPYWDATIPDCTACPDGLYYNRYTSGCQTECPEYAPNYNNTKSNTSCLPCPTSDPYWNDNSTDPILMLADGETWAQCLQKCEFPWPDHDTNNFCKACPSDPSNPGNPTLNKPYWDEQTGQCMISCPQKRPDPGTNKYCKACPAEKPLWDPVNGCVACPNLTPFFDTRVWGCVENCAVSTPETPAMDLFGWCQNCTTLGLVYWDNITSTCTNWCNRPTPTNDSLSWCANCTIAYPAATPATPKWNPDSYSCVETCPAYLPETDSDSFCKACDRNVPKWSESDSECQECDIGTHWDVLPNYASLGSCIPSCPPERPKVDDTNWCVTCGPTQYWDSIVSSPHDCVDSCPPVAPANDNNRWCKPCDSLTYWDDTTKSCLGTCPDARPIIGANNWCVPCPPGQFWDTASKTCGTTCPTATPLVNSDRVCVSCTNTIWDPSISQCTSSCEGSYQLNVGGQCQACPSGTPKWNSATSSCVATCPDGKPYTDSNNRCQACPTGKWNPLTSMCATTCPQTHPNVNNNNWCEACPSTAPKWNDVSFTCTADCPATRPLLGTNNWCQACPVEYLYWHRINSICVSSCQPPLPLVDSNSWCQACPSATPYWNAATASCVPICPRNTPAVDANNVCQPCPSATPNWDNVTTQCYNICPSPRPAIGADNWCQECTSATPYWYGINSACVAICPPQAPSIGKENWCEKCSGALLKWDPLISQCVATCPADLPFFNKNTMPPACEQGPDVEDIMNYLQTSGVVMPSTLAGMQLAMPGLPYVAVTILLISLLKYVRYLNINFPAKVAKVFQQGSLNIPSLNFGPLFPENWKLDTYSHPAPYRFAQYDINGLFVANFWRGISTTLIIAAGVALIQLIIRKRIKNEKVVQVREKAKNFLIWNYVFSFYISNVGNLVLFLFIEYQSLYFHDGIGTGSFLVNIAFVQLSIAGIVYMIKLINRAHKIKKEAAKSQQKLPIDESIKVLLEKFKNEHQMQMLFIPIMCIRAVVNAIIMSAVNNPTVQCSLLVVLNIIMIAYYIRYRPHREIVDNIQLTAFEICLSIVNLTCLHLSTLTPEEQFASEEAADVLVGCNILMFVLSFVFVFSKVIIAVIRAIREKFRLRRPMNTVYVQTDVSSTVEMTPRSSKYARLETKAEDISPDNKNKVRSLNFGPGSVSIMDVGSEGEQSPQVVSRNINSNNLKKSFQIVRIPSGEEESQHLSRYLDKGVQ